jgi:two-component system, chemotaxis family, chemotaxis protein CheY
MKATATNGGPPAVLLVEDAEECSAALEIALHTLGGYAVLVCPSAEEALAVVKTRPVAALITDYHLPGMDGLELVAHLRQDSRWARLPILVTSGDCHPATPQRALLAGADGYFGKPYSPAALRIKLEELLHDR